MATKIKLMRLGKTRQPYYRIVVADARTKRQGRAIETIGKYHPKRDPSFIEVDGDRAQYWLGVGAQPTEAVAAILKVTGDWQKFRGEAAPPPMKVAEPRPDKAAIFAQAASEASGLAEAAGSGSATTAKRKTADKAEKSEKAEKSAKTDSAEKPAAADKADKADSAAKAETADKPAADAAAAEGK